MTVSVLSIGDELLIGQVVNTNASWLGQQFSAHGMSVRRVVMLGDDASDIQAELMSELELVDAVICTGGLGPTHDDITKRAIADGLDRQLVRHHDLVETLRRRYESRGRSMPQAAHVMADVPEDFEALPNPGGAAPGLWYRGSVPGIEGERVIVILPGVPDEMKTIMQRTVLPRLVMLHGEAAVVQKTLLTAGVGESHLAEMIDDLEDWLTDDLKLAFLPGYGVVRLRITARADTRAEAQELLYRFESHLQARLGDLIFGEGEDSLPAAVGRMLHDRGLTLAIAESCSGGRIADEVTNVAGSSDYMLGSVVAYCNRTKIELLSVEQAALEEEGAVSEKVARQMAEGVRLRLGADIGISTTGVAGPGGGTAEKPVGTVWLGYADAAGSYAVRLMLGSERIQNKRLSVMAALNLIRKQLLRHNRKGEAANPPSGSVSL